MILDCHFHGKTKYEKSLELQDRAVAQSDSKGQILGFEYDPVITLGRSAKAEEEVYDPQGWPIFTVPRGGKATLHSPGQLVIYPVCNIKVFGQGKVKSWVSQLLKVTQLCLTEECPEVSFELSMERAGIYSARGKVASIGIRVNRGVSTFGLAINLQNDSALFESIRPCGVQGQKIHSLGVSCSLEEFFKGWCEEFKKTIPSH